MFARNLRARSANGQVIEASDNIFGFEEPIDKLASESKQVFESAQQAVLAYASKDKQALISLQDPESTVALPTVTTTELSGQLRFRSFTDGNNSLYLAGLNRNGDNQGGFILIQNPHGAVTVVDTKLKQVFGRDDAEYPAYIAKAKEYLDIYFKALKVKSSGDALSGESMFDIRQQLGAMSAKAARKSLKQALK
jgi:hypothetical protein